MTPGVVSNTSATLPETKSLHLKMECWKMIFLLGIVYFKGLWRLVSGRLLLGTACSIAEALPIMHRSWCWSGAEKWCIVHVDAAVGSVSIGSRDTFSIEYFLFAYLIHLSIHPSIPPSVRPSIYPSIQLSIHLPIRPSIHPSIHPFIHLSIYLSIYLSVCLSVCLSTYTVLPIPIPLHIYSLHLCLSFRLKQTCDKTNYIYYLGPPWWDPSSDHWCLPWLVAASGYLARRCATCQAAGTSVSCNLGSLSEIISSNWLGYAIQRRCIFPPGHGWHTHTHKSQYLFERVLWGIVACQNG